MIRNTLMRHLEATGSWVATQSKHRDRYLIEQDLLKRPDRGFQNLLKLEIGVTNSHLLQHSLKYQLHLTIRVVKVIYLDATSTNSIGLQSFYKVPHFENYNLSQIYKQIPTGSKDKPIQYLKLKNLHSESLEICPSELLVWSLPYELPCQSLFYAILNYQSVAENFPGATLTDFSFVHLSNIKNIDPSACTNNTSPKLESSTDVSSEFEQGLCQKLDSEGSTRWNGSEEKPCWGDLDAPFVGFKIAKVCLEKKIQSHQPLQMYQPEMVQPGAEQGKRTAAVDESLIAQNAQMEYLLADENVLGPLKSRSSSEVVNLQAERLQELVRLLTFIHLHPSAKLYFDKNGSRSVYAKFREVHSEERALHSVIHYFIACHLPKTLPAEAERGAASSSLPKEILKSNLKDKEYQIRISADVDLKEKNFFCTEITRAQIRKRKDHVDKFVQMTQVPPDITDMQLLQMAQPTVVSQQPEGFRTDCQTRAVQRKPSLAAIRPSDYSLIKRKQVKVNVVEKQVFEFEVNKEEKQHKSTKKSKKHKKHKKHNK